MTLKESITKATGIHLEDAYWGKTNPIIEIGPNASCLEDNIRYLSNRIGCEVKALNSYRFELINY